MHTAPIPQTGLQGLLPRGAPGLWLSLLAFFVMLSPFLGPALDHHFAERLPNHLHIFAGGLPHDHTTTATPTPTAMKAQPPSNTFPASTPAKG